MLGYIPFSDECIPITLTLCNANLEVAITESRYVPMLMPSFEIEIYLHKTQRDLHPCRSLGLLHPR